VSVCVCVCVRERERERERESRMNVSCHIWMCHVTYKWITSPTKRDLSMRRPKWKGTCQRDPLSCKNTSFRKETDKWVTSHMQRYLSMRRPMWKGTCQRDPLTCKIPLCEKRPINESRHICKETYQCDVPFEKEPVNVTHLLAKYLFAKRDR